MLRAFLGLMAILLVASCADAVMDPGTNLDGLPEGLQVEFIVEPGEVSQHEPLMARLRVTNTSSNAIGVVTSNSCLALPAAWQDDRRIPFAGTALGCYTAITQHLFAAGETRSYDWPLRAELYAEQPGDVNGKPALVGAYRVRAEFDPISGDWSAVEKTVIVR